MVVHERGWQRRITSTIDHGWFLLGKRSASMCSCKSVVCASFLGFFPATGQNYSTLFTILNLFKKSSRIHYYSKISNCLKTRRLLDEKRHAVHEKIPNPADVHSYTRMIIGCSKNNRLDDALKLFDKMPTKDTVAWNSMMKACLDSGDLSTAKSLFDRTPDRNVVSWTMMVSGYLQFGKIEVAETLFKEMPYRDVTAWNAMIHGYLSNNRVDDALQLFEDMPCRNVISWTSIIGGLDKLGRSHEALSFFRCMIDSGVIPNSITLCSVITACATTLAAHQGTQIHAFAMKSGSYLDDFVSASLITFYANCQHVEDFHKVFDEKTATNNVVLWTSLLTGFSVTSCHEDALKVFSKMMKINVFPNQSSFTSTLTSCCSLEAQEKGKEIHAISIKLGFGTDTFVGNSLIVLYFRYGSVRDGVAAFKMIANKNQVSWNSIITGCAQHGCWKWVLSLFSLMIRANVESDGITLSGLLSACNHSGMLPQARRFFQYFSHQSGWSIDLKLEHYACMVDIMGRCGKLEEAEEFINNMPKKPNSSVWLSLLNACRLHSNLEIAERSANITLDLDPHCSAAYILLSNLYASSSRWSDVSRLRSSMRKKGIIKQQGCSWINLRGTMHEFLSGDRSHPLSEEIYRKVEWIEGKLKEFGYVPDSNFALHDVDDEQKGIILSHHSERLAIAFGLIVTVEGSPITVMKNLRVCGDCHSAIKLIAKIVEREIILRDSSRFHHFRDGLCSCGDYW